MRWVATVGLLLVAGIVVACPFCNSTGTTLTQDAGDAGMILFGTLKNPRLDPKANMQGATDLEIEIVIKSHPYLGDRKVITLPKYIPFDAKQPGKYLVFCAIFKGELDPYHGVPFKDGSHIAQYLKGSLELKDKDLATRLRFFFDYLDDPDTHIAQDAYTEFGYVDYMAFRPIAEKLPADRVIKWLRDADTPASRLGLYGSILGHCGKATDAAVLRGIIDDKARRTLMGLDGVFAGLTLLSPKEGWAKTVETMIDAKRDYTVRYSAMKSAQFFWDYRPDVVTHDALGEGVTRMIELPDAADFAIETLGKWGYWKSVDKVMALSHQPGYDTNLIQRALVRYALRCPPNISPAVAAYLVQQREKNPERVKDAESMLTAESAPPPGKQKP